MYYKLKPPFSFRGWRKLPYAIRAEWGDECFQRPRFFGKALFLELLYLNGVDDIEPSTMSEPFQRILADMIDKEAVEASDEPLGPLEPWQRYRVYPSPYMQAVHWAITGRCNFRCRHCLVSAPYAHQPQLPLSDLVHLADEMARCGINTVDITGGEPLLRGDFIEVVEELSRRAIHIRTIFTNASLLNDELLDAMWACGQAPSFQLSFDGLGHHDWLRGVSGAEAQADAAFRLLRRRGVSVAAAMIIHRGNKDSLRDTVGYLAGLGVRSLRVNAPQELGVWKEYSDAWALTQDEVWDAYRAYIPQYLADGSPIDLELDGFFACRRGERDFSVPYAHHTKENTDWARVPYCESMRYNLHIRPDGRVAPCMGFSNTVLGDRFPSVMEEHLGDIMLGGYYRDVTSTKLADVLARNPECAACMHWPECNGGCMLESMSEDGDYLVPDQRACWFHKNVGVDAVRAAAAATT